MRDLLDFFLKNPEYLAGLIGFAAILSLVVLIVAIIAFVQGREVAIGPIKFGQSQLKKENADTSKPPSVDHQTAASGFVSDYPNAHKADVAAMANTTSSLDFLGISSQFLYTREGFLKFAENRAIAFRFLLLDPRSYYANQLEQLEGIPVRRNIITSARNLLDLSSKNPRIRIRFYKREPFFRVLNVDHSMSFVSYYGTTQNNPNISFRQTSEGTSFVSPMLALFERYWDESTEVRSEVLDAIEDELSGTPRLLAHHEDQRYLAQQLDSAHSIKVPR